MKRERTIYYRTFVKARSIRERLTARWPDARVVEYERGFAVQLYRSGPYVGNRLRRS